MIALCLSAGALSATLSIQAFTLAWMHSVEKVRWEEDWKIEGKTLRLVEARIKGMGAGMEPPAGAVFREGSWHFTPSLAPMKSLNLSHSPYTKGYEFCIKDKCQQLTDFLPHIEETAVIVIEACER